MSLHPLLSSGNDHLHALPEINNIMREMVIQFLIFCSTLCFVFLKMYGGLCQMPTHMDPTKDNF